MEEYKYKEEYDDMVKEYNNFKKIYEILKISAKEIQKSMGKNDTISYFCIITNEEKTYIAAFYINGMIAVVKEWLQNDCKMSEEHICDIILKCVNTSN